jgi:hypothetical protein
VRLPPIAILKWIARTVTNDMSLVRDLRPVYSLSAVLLLRIGGGIVAGVKIVMVHYFDYNL